MGADWFESEAQGISLQEAFALAVQRAQWEHGHAGYTGTIAEKEDVVDVLNGEVAADREAAQVIVDRFNRDETSPINDKWGPAGAVRYGLGAGQQQNWVFFGWASS